MNTEIIINSLISAIENRDADAVGNLLAEDVAFENVPDDNVTHGRKAAQEQFAGFFAKTSSIHWDIQHKIINGNIAAIARNNHITFQGKNIILPMVTIIEVVNGKVKLFKDYFDSQTFAKQM